MKKITNFSVFLVFTFLVFSFNPTKAMDEDSEEATSLLQAMEEQEQEEPKIINFEKDEMLKECMQITQKTVINGNGHILFLANKNIVVKKGAELSLENITIKGLKETNILCAGPNSKITILGNVTWLLCKNYKFLNGSFHVLENSNLTITKDPEMPPLPVKTNRQLPGFAYLSSQQSFVSNNAKLAISDITFFFYPIPKFFEAIFYKQNLYNYNLYLESSNSTLVLHNSTLQFWDRALHLITGKLILSGHNRLISRGKNALRLGTKQSALKVIFSTENPPCLETMLQKNSGEYILIDAFKLINTDYAIK